MAMWKRILVPHDFSLCATRALDVAVGLAVDGHATLVLLHVSPLPPNLPSEARVVAPDGSLVTVDELLTRGAGRDLVALAEPLRARGVSVEVSAQTSQVGTPAAAILRSASELAADVIVLGTHGRTGLAHLVLGSVAEEVMRGARVPVVTVRSRDEATHLTREESAAEDELAG